MSRSPMPARYGRQQWHLCLRLSQPRSRLKRGVNVVSPARGSFKGSSLGFEKENIVSTVTEDKRQHAQGNHADSEPKLTPSTLDSKLQV
jgi:hypothetical protein